MASLVFNVHSRSNPNAAPLGTLTDVSDKQLGIEDNAVGNGGFNIHPDSAQIGLITNGNYVKAYRDSVSAANLLGGFWIESGGDTLLADTEAGGQNWQRGGRGPIAILEEAIVWHKATSGTEKNIERAKNRWVWKNAHPARVLVRLLEEAKARNTLPGVSWDFSRTRDSDNVKWSSANFDRFEVPIGANLLDVVGVLRDNDLWVYMDANLVLHAYDNEKDNDLSGSIDIEEGVNIRETSERTIAGSTARSHVLVQGNNEDEKSRYAYAGDATVRSQIGRRKEGYFEYPRTSTKAILRRVARRKIRKWKKQFDGPFTLGVIDTVGQVPGIDFTVGDEVNVNIPGAYNNSTERVIGITFVERDNGEYDSIVDFGDFAHDANGNYMGGDSSGLNPCGCGGKKPGGGFGGGGGGTPPPSVPGTTPVREGTYFLDDFNRTSSDVGYQFEVGTSIPTEPLYGISALTKQLHEIPVPSGGAVDDVKFIFSDFTSQNDGLTPSISYSPLVGYAPRVLGQSETKVADALADDIDIAIPDGAREGDILLVWIVHYRGTVGGDYGAPGNYWDWSPADSAYVNSGSSHGGTPAGYATMVGIRLDATNMAALGITGLQDDTVNTGDASNAASARQDQSWAIAWLVRDVADMVTDGIYGWNGSPTTSALIGSLNPTSGWFDYNSGDMTLFFSAAAADGAISGEHNEYNELYSDTELNIDGAGNDAGTIVSARWDDATTQAPTPNRTFPGSLQVQTIFALRAGPGWTGFEGHTNISHAPTMHRFRTLDGSEPDVDYVHVLLNEPAAVGYDKEANVGYATGLLINPGSYIEGTDLLHGGTDQPYFPDMVGPSPDNGDFVYFGYVSVGGAGDEFLNGDIGTWDFTTLDFSGSPNGFQTVKLVGTREDDLNPHGLFAYRSSSNQFEFNFITRWAVSASTNATDEDTSTISTGANGGGLLENNYVLNSDGGLGTILTSGQNGGSPWPGGNPWSFLTGPVGDLTEFGLDGDYLFAQGDNTVGGGFASFYVFGDERVLPFSADSWEMELRYRQTGKTLPSLDGTLHRLSGSWQYPYMSFSVEFGSSTPNGVKVQSGVSPATNDILTKTVAGTGNWGRVKWRKEGLRHFLKEWAESGSEPSWQVADDILPSALDESAETYDSQDRFTLDFIVGCSGVADVRLEVDWVKVTTVAEGGSLVIEKLVARGDGSTTKFFLGSSFKEGTLIVAVDGNRTTPVEWDAEEGWFRLDRAPYGDPADETGSSLVTANYEKA